MRQCTGYCKEKQDIDHSWVVSLSGTWERTPLLSTRTLLLGITQPILQMVVCTRRSFITWVVYSLVMWLEMCDHNWWIQITWTSGLETVHCILKTTSDLAISRRHKPPTAGIPGRQLYKVIWRLSFGGGGHWRRLHLGRAPLRSLKSISA